MTINTDMKLDFDQVTKDFFSQIGPWFSSVSISEEAFEKLSAAHPEVILEQETDGKVKFMSPVHLNSGAFENDS